VKIDLTVLLFDLERKRKFQRSAFGKSISHS